MYHKNADVSPFNALPPVVLLIAGLIAAVEIIFQAGAAGLAGDARAVGWRLDALQDYAFFPRVMGAMWEQGYYPYEHMRRFVTFPFVHRSFIDAAFGCVIVLAIGKSVGEVFGTARFLIVFFASAVLGAFVYGLTGDDFPLVGAYTGGYGLIGAFTFMLWVSLAATGENEMRAFTLIAFLMGIQLVFGLLFGGGLGWVADLFGFIAGFILAFLMSPGGWSRVLAKLRARR
ncbi:rhomboid family protein [Litoreibacter ponti]|uniref:Rhomboid family protein n=1 Tax=Litoreibacter ponti TaxID=1510457 RepID=A0A2T6BM20_9RHOB|nr:rhomboid family intramembrane serine protease [Litoreibacter ponti]PTX57124.1 rhomboid family protein [Litoreibacter ponti]